MNWDRSSLAPMKEDNTSRWLPLNCSLPRGQSISRASRIFGGQLIQVTKDRALQLPPLKSQWCFCRAKVLHKGCRGFGPRSHVRLE